MSRLQTAVAGLAVVLILVVLVFPPYFGIDVESGGTLHASIGHHPIWDPPSSEYVCHALNPEAVEVCREGTSAYRSGLNKVRLVLQEVLLVVGMFVVLLVVRRRERAAWQAFAAEGTDGPYEPREYGRLGSLISQWRALEGRWISS